MQYKQEVSSFLTFTFFCVQLYLQSYNFFFIYTYIYIYVFSFAFEMSGLIPPDMAVTPLYSLLPCSSDKSIKSVKCVPFIDYWNA